MLTADKLKAHETPKSKTGPKTPRGKKAVSRNAVKHGIRSPHPFIIEDLESPAEWEEFKLGILESWQPVGVQEVELAINLAWDHWKLRRCRLYENAILSKQVEETEYELQQEDADEDDLPDGAPLPEIEPERLIHHQHAKVIPDGWSMDRILRYEAFVRKALGQDMHELEIQQARRGGIQALPARVVFSSDPSGAPPPRPPSNTAAIRQLNQHVSRNVARAEGALAERERAARADDLPEFLAKDDGWRRGCGAD